MWEEVMTSSHSHTVFSLLFKVAEAMEIMLIAVVSPVIRCEWQLENWQVALVTTVSATNEPTEDPGLLLPSPTPQGLEPEKTSPLGVLAATAHGFAGLN